MIKVALVRGKYLNNFEGQNYLLKKVKLTAISSLAPLDSDVSFPLIKLASLSDLPLPFLKQASNRLLGDAQILFGLEKLATEFDIFHTADPHYYYSYQLAKLRSQNKIKRLISTSWETIPFNNETVARKKLIKDFTKKYVDLFICYTERAKQALIVEGVDERRIKVVRLGVNLNNFQFPISNFQSNHKSQKEIAILFVGRLVEEKGINDLNVAFQNVKLKIKNLKLKIIQSGSVDYRNMPKIYQEADIFVLPAKKSKTWEEQYGMVLVEAMASGLPIIAYDTGAISEVIGDSGMLVKEGDISGLATQIQRLASDGTLRQKLGRMGRSRAKKLFDCRKTANSIEKIYLEI